MDTLTVELLTIKKKLAAQFKKHHHASKVIIMFDSELGQRSCLEKMSVGIIPAALDKKGYVEEKYMFQGNLLNVREAPEVI